MICAVSVSFCRLLGALLQSFAGLLGPPRPLSTISKASRAVLTVSRTHLGQFGRPFGALPVRFRPAKGVPGGASNAPKLSANAPLSLSVSLFGFNRCFRHLLVRICAVVGTFSGPPGVILGSFPRPVSCPSPFPLLRAASELQNIFDDATCLRRAKLTGNNFQNISTSRARSGHRSHQPTKFPKRWGGGVCPLRGVQLNN